MVKRRGLAALAMGLALVITAVGCAEDDDFLIGGKRPTTKPTTNPGGTGGNGGGNGDGSDIGGGIGTGDKPVATPTPAPTATPTPEPTPPPSGTIFTHIVQYENPEGIAFDAEGNAWVALYGSGTSTSVLTKLAPDGRLLGEPPVGIGPRQVAVDGRGHVWVTNFGSGTVSRVSPEDGSAITLEVGGEPRALSFAPGGDELWVAAETVVAVDLDTQATRSVIPHAAAGIAFHEDKAWVTYQASNSVGVYSLGGILDREIDVGTPPTLVRASSDAVWVLTYNGAVRINPETDTKRSISLDGAQDLAFDTFGRVWISQASPPRVIRYQANGDYDTEFTIGLAPRGLAFHPTTGYLWVTDRSAKSVRVFVP